MYKHKESFSMKEKMVSGSSYVSLVLSICIVILVHNANAQRRQPPQIFDVRTYGAVGDGKTNNAKAFLEAWSDACRWKGRSMVYIPWGTYMLGSVIFRGWCRGPIIFLIKGTLRAPSDPNLFFVDHWITFLYVDGLVVKGGGYLDGQGHSAWKYNDCFTNSHCKPLPVSVRFDFVENAKIHHIKSINSKNAHFYLYGCDNMNMSHIRIKAPNESPNTDGIHIGSSTNIQIRRSIIETGDDCISMVSGSQNIYISDVACGPGHGISIGSLGKSHEKEYVTGLSVRNCSFHGTQNGVRIKTWAPSLATLASNFLFEDIVMNNVNNPIIIDQQYCPAANCDANAHSEVQIRNVTFKNIRGVSSSQVAISLKCSGAVPCENIKLVNINLAYKGPGGPAFGMCSNVRGESIGRQNPPACI